MIVDQLLLLFISHASESIILSFERAIKRSQSCGDNLLNLPSLGSGAVWWEAESSDAPASADSGRQDIVGIKILPTSKIVGIEVSFVLVCLLETTMTSFDDWIEKIGKYFVGFLISSYHAYCHDERVAWIVDASLDGSVEGEAIGCLQFGELGVDFRCDALGHVVVVLGEIWEARM